MIDKLPFPPPDDPLHRARGDRAEAERGNAFSHYWVPVATLALKQGLGRLIRTRADLGSPPFSIRVS